MGLTDFFKKPKGTTYQETPIGAEARKQELEALKYTAPNIGQTYQGRVSIDPSQLTTTGADIIQNRLTTPFKYEGVDESAFDKLMSTSLQSFDEATPSYLNPILEAEIGKGMIRSGSGKNALLRGATERATQRANIANQLGVDKLNFMKSLQDSLQGYQQQDLSNALTYGGRLEDIDKYNVGAEAEMYFKNLNLPFEQAQILSGLQTAEVPRESSLTGIENYNQSLKSPFQNLLNTGLATLGGNIMGNVGEGLANKVTSGLGLQTDTDKLLQLLLKGV